MKMPRSRRSIQRSSHDIGPRRPGHSLLPPKARVFSPPEKLHRGLPDDRRDGPAGFLRCAPSSLPRVDQRRCSKFRRYRRTPVSRRDGPLVRSTETQCVMEPEFRHPDKRPWRDAASTRQSSTKNKGPLLLFPHKRPTPLQTLRILWREYTNRNSWRGDLLRALRHSQKLSTTG